MNATQFYLRLKNLIHSLDQKEGLAELDLVSMRLLEIIALCAVDDKPMTVSEAMALVDLGSPATLHRKLDTLREAGLIDTQHVGSDRRTKFLHPTDKALAHFETLSSMVSFNLQQPAR